jgi:putative flavoprotein involved in K+ transport
MYFMNNNHETDRYKIIVIGGGQAGLAMGYYLLQTGFPFIILDACERIGDSWRRRWDSLRLFTPSRFDGLPGMPFPAPSYYFPTKDEMGDYLESYAEHFRLPVLSGVTVDALWREGNLYKVKAGDLFWETEQVVVAMSNYQHPKIPSFAKELVEDIVQIHSCDYKNPSQLQEGSVLIVGAGNSGAEIAMELAKTHEVYLSGRDVGHIPFNIEGRAAKWFLARFVLRFLFYRVLTTNTFLGKKVRPKMVSQGGPLIRQKPKMISRAGIKRVAKLAGVHEGKPVFENKMILDVKNVIWCTGFYPRFAWIDVPVFRDDEPTQNRGVVAGEPGLYFLGLHFLFAFSSSMIHGVGRDARYIAGVIISRLKKENLSMSHTSVALEY